MRGPLSLKVLAGLVLAVALDPGPAWATSSDDAVALHAEGVRLAKANLPREALSFLEKAVKLDPSFAEAFADLGSAQIALRAMPEAITALETALRLRPELSTARYNLAFAHRKMGAHAQAAAHYRAYLEAAPDDADAQYGLAETLRAAGELGAAADAYDAYAAVEKRPEQAGWVVKAQQQARALRADVASQALASPPRAGEEAVVASTGLPAAARAPQGEAEIERALATEFDKPEPVVEPASRGSRSRSFRAGLSFLERGKYESALPALLKAVEEAPGDALVQAALGSAHLGLRQAREAEVAYRRALATASREAVPGLWLGVGEALRLRGENEEARRAFAWAIDHPGSPPLIRKLAAERAAALR